MSGVFSSEERAKEAFPATDWGITAGVLWSQSRQTMIEEWEIDDTEHLSS